MKWQKRGLIYGPDGSSSWARHSCLTPTPVLIGDIIRVYCGFRDGEGRSRIGFVDVRADDPSVVVAVSREPVLDIGMAGCFDDNGVILGDVVADGDRLRMYYVGFQIVARVKFLAFTGLAFSTDGGNSFQRAQAAPVLDRADEGLFIRAVHTAMPDKTGGWRIWYAAGSGWEPIKGGFYPQYHIRHQASVDGIRFDTTGDLCLPPAGREYRIGRPRVYLGEAGYRMIFTKGSVDGDYTPGYATSRDGVHWNRDDSQLGIGLSDDGWDSRHLCYPSVIHYGSRIWMFYNGNDMGVDGFGYAELIAH
ncbi:hypothetical protein [Ferrovibrio terrae]|uniref:hypothetical protein n=1 Tax=Ferrovibrio terrae TaxID=2594003 RepID=UPI0031378F0F